MADIRIQCLPDEVSEMVDDLRSLYDIIEESRPKPNRPPSKLVRVYLKVAPLQIPDLHGGHVGQTIKVDGEDVHVLAAPDMSAETAEALAEVVRAARRYLDRETITVRELAEVGQEIDGEGWGIEIFGEWFLVISIQPPKGDGDYQVIYHMPGRTSRHHRTTFCNGDTVLKRLEVEDGDNYE